MGLTFSEVPETAGAVVEGLGQSLVGLAAVERAVLSAGGADVVNDVPAAEGELLVGVPGGVGGLADVVCGVKLAGEYEHIGLQAAGDLMAGHLYDLRVVAGGGAYAEYYGGLQAGVVVLRLSLAQRLVVRELIRVQLFLGESVGVHVYLLPGEGQAELVSQHVQHYVVKAEVAAVEYGGRVRAVGAHGVADHADAGGVDELQRADEVQSVGHTHRRGGGQLALDAVGDVDGRIEARQTLLGVVIVGLGAHAGAVGADVEHHKAAPSYLLGRVLHGAVCAAAAMVGYDRGQAVVARRAGGIVELAGQLGASGVDCDFFNLDFAEIGLYQLGEKAADKDYRGAEQREPDAALLRAEAKKLPFFHFPFSFSDLLFRTAPASRSAVCAARESLLSG